MAGFYPDVPGNRFAYQMDGTKIYTIDNSNTLVDITSSASTLTNDEDTDFLSIGNVMSVMFLFPEQRTLSGYFFQDNWSIAPGSLQVSSDTTSGLDGTWTTVVNPWTKDGSVGTLPRYRQFINPISAGPIKAVKFNWPSLATPRLYSIHLYGSIPSTENPNRLIFWEPVNNNQTSGAYFDWGDVVQGSTQTKQFRIKNNSSTQTANSIVISAGTETFGMALSFSTDGTTFNPTINIGNLGPGATSSVLYVRRVVPANEPMQVQAAWMKAHAGSWV